MNRYKLHEPRPHRLLIDSGDLFQHKEHAWLWMRIMEPQKTPHLWRVGYIVTDGNIWNPTDMMTTKEIFETWNASTNECLKIYLG